MMMHSYIIRAASEADLIALLETAQPGKERPFVFETETGKTVDAARITYPRSDEEGWLCEVRLPAPDAELEALAAR